MESLKCIADIRTLSLKAESVFIILGQISYRFPRQSLKCLRKETKLAAFSRRFTVCLGTDCSTISGIPRKMMMMMTMIIIIIIIIIIFPEMAKSISKHVLEIMKGGHAY